MSNCSRCGYPKEEHHYNGACYGICGEFVEPICTCAWSPVNTTTIDPPHIVLRDPNCPRHGDQADDATRAEKDAQRRRDAAAGFEDEA